MDPWALGRPPWHAPMWDTGADGRAFVPGVVHQHAECWDKVILQDQPLRDTMLSYLRDGVGVRCFLIDPCRGPSVDRPYNDNCFPGAVFANRISPALARLVYSKLQLALCRGCVAK